MFCFVLFFLFAEGGKPGNQEKNPQSKVTTNNKLNTHMTLGPGIEPGPHWWEASALTDNCAITASQKENSSLFQVLGSWGTSKEKGQAGEKTRKD